MNYFILYYDRNDRAQYIESIRATAQILLESDNFMVVSADQQLTRLFPAVHEE